MTTDEFAAAVARMRVPGVPAKVVQVVAQLATAPEGDLVYYIEFFQVSELLPPPLGRRCLRLRSLPPPPPHALLCASTFWLTLLPTAVSLRAAT